MSKKFSHSVIFTKREIAVLRINISYKKASEGWKNKEPRKNKDINLKSVLVFREVGLVHSNSSWRKPVFVIDHTGVGMFWFIFLRTEVDHSFTQVTVSVSLMYTAEDSACITPSYLFSALPADTVPKGDFLKKGLILHICYIKNVFKT